MSFRVIRMKKTGRHQSQWHWSGRWQRQPQLEQHREGDGKQVLRRWELQHRGIREKSSRNNTLEKWGEGRRNKRRSREPGASPSIHLNSCKATPLNLSYCEMKVFLMGPLDADLEAIVKQWEDHESNILPPWTNPLISPQLRMSKDVVFSLSP